MLTTYRDSVRTHRVCHLICGSEAKGSISGIKCNRRVSIALHKTEQWIGHLCVACVFDGACGFRGHPCRNDGRLDSIIDIKGIAIICGDIDGREFAIWFKDQCDRVGRTQTEVYVINSHLESVSARRRISSVVKCDS